MIGPALPALALACGLAVAGATAPPPDPWPLLGELREKLARNRLEADFVQTFIPAGFSRGEEESGQVALALPDCLRWDYLLPYPKSFLACGRSAYTWSPGERQGRFFRLAGEEEAGFDLLLLPLDELRARYQAEPQESGGNRITLTFRPRLAGAVVREVRISLERADLRLTELAWRDGEGNLTRFSLTGWRPLADSDAFNPPQGVDWKEE